MKAFLVILLAAMTAWVAVTADQMEKAHKAAGRPAKSRVVKSENPAVQQLHEIVRIYGARQVLMAIVGIVAGLLLALTVALKILKMIALGCVMFLLFVLWQAWERGYITEIRSESPMRCCPQYLA